MSEAAHSHRVRVSGGCRGAEKLQICCRRASISPDKANNVK